MLESEVYNLLDPDESYKLAAALGDNADTTIVVHALERNLGRAFVIGSPSRFEAALVEGANLPAEPHGFSKSPDTLCSLLSQVHGWDCVLVDPDLSEPLASLIQRKIAPKTRFYESAHLALTSQVVRQSHPRVRFLDVRDIPLIRASPQELQPDGFQNLQECLTVGTAAGAVINGQLVSIAYVGALTRRYGEITVQTLPESRNRGLAATSASLVASHLQGQGRIPVWYTGADNGPSLRIAAKLGFLEVSRPVFVIKESD